MDKKALLWQAITDFEKSEQKAEDYMKLLVTGHKVFQQGGGLLYSEAAAVVREVVGE